MLFRIQPVERDPEERSVFQVKRPGGRCTRLRDGGIHAAVFAQFDRFEGRLEIRMNVLAQTIPI